MEDEQVRDFLSADSPQAANAAQQEQMIMKHAADVGVVGSLWATAFSVFVTQQGRIRVTYGDQLHPAVAPTFSSAFTTELESARGLHNLLGRTIEAMDAQQKMFDAAKVKEAEFDVGVVEAHGNSKVADFGFDP